MIEWKRWMLALGVRHGEAEHRRGKEVVKTAGGEHRSNAGFEPSPSECDEYDGQKVQKSCDKGLGVTLIIHRRQGRNDQGGGQNAQSSRDDPVPHSVPEHKRYLARHKKEVSNPSALKNHES